jgi:transposase
MDKITQDMKYRHSLVKYALNQGVSKACRKYNKSRSYIYYWLDRYDGDIRSLACRSRRPKHHPNQHSQDEIGMIRRYRERNKGLGLYELWFKLRKQGYRRHYVSLYRVVRMAIQHFLKNQVISMVLGHPNSNLYFSISEAIK